MADESELISAGNLGTRHAFLDAAQSDARDFKRAVGDAQPVFLEQVHSADAVIVDQPWDEGDAPQADAMATGKRGIALAIVTADCVPVLLLDKEAGIIGAAHAGWRGAHGGVIEAVIRRMEELGASRSGIAAAIGPCIAQANYEVGPEMRALFDPADYDLFAPTSPGKWQFDLGSYVERQLRMAEIESIEALDIDTYAGTDRFYSYRRATHQSAPATGRQISLIALPG